MCLLFAGFVVTVVLTTPWNPLPGAVPGGHVRPDAARDFTAAQIAHETRFHDAVRPWGLAGLAVGLLVPMVLGFTPIGARLVSRLGRRRWLFVVAVAAIGVPVLSTLVSLPIAAREHAILRQYGLTYQSWSGWADDVARSSLVEVVTTFIGLVIVMGLAKKFPRRWWAPAAALSAAFVIGGSFVYPYVVEPLFNHFHSLPAGPERSGILALAARDHQPLADVLVADASRRTTTENAYVSGFGASRRLVLDDTLLSSDNQQEVLVIAAHELGHAKNDDVLHGTIEGGLVVGAAMCALFLLLGARAGDPRRAPLLLALYVTVSFVVSPVTFLISRHIEARADAHSLALTQDPQSFIDAQQQLAVTNLDDLRPSSILYVLFFDHPSTPERIAMARDWERQHPTAIPFRP